MSSDKEKELYQQGLAKTRGSLWGRIKGVFRGKTSIGEEDLEELEEILITGDVGMQYTTMLVEDLRRLGGSVMSDGELRSFIRGWVEGIVRERSAPVPETGSTPDNVPRVSLIVGVNGTGKTTTAGKLASRLMRANRRTMVVAADTYPTSDPI